MEDFGYKLEKLVIAREVIIQAKHMGWTPYEVVAQVVGHCHKTLDCKNWVDAEHFIYEKLLVNDFNKQPLLDFIQWVSLEIQRDHSVTANG